MIKNSQSTFKLLLKEQFSTLTLSRALYDIYTWIAISWVQFITNYKNYLSDNNGNFADMCALYDNVLVKRISIVKVSV